MPLKPGKDKKTISSNIREFHTGKTYAHTQSKFGKEKADKQAIAVALSTARKYAKKADGGADLDSPSRRKQDKQTADFNIKGTEWDNFRRSPDVEDRTGTQGYKRVRLPPRNAIDDLSFAETGPLEDALGAQQIDALEYPDPQFLNRFAGQYVPSSRTEDARRTLASVMYSRAGALRREQSPEFLDRFWAYSEAPNDVDARIGRIHQMNGGMERRASQIRQEQGLPRPQELVDDPATFAEGGAPEATWEGADEEARQNLEALGPQAAPSKSWVPSAGQLSKWWYGDQPEKSIENEADLTNDPVSRAIKGVGQAFTAPGRALKGEIPPEQMVPEALSMAMTGMGATSISPIKGGLGTGVGRLSVGKHLEQLPTFERLEAKGVHPEENFTTTGWYRGDDNMPRYWVDDSKARLKTENLPVHEGKAYVPYDPAVGEPAKLGDIWDHPELYKAHPWLKDMEVWPTPPEDPYLGMYEPVSKSIQIKDLPPDEFHDVLHHEVIHAIQHHEGFANGGVLEKFLPDKFKERTAAVDKQLNDIVLKVQNRGIPPESIPWDDLPRILAGNLSKLKPEDIMVRHDLNSAGVLQPLQKIIKEKEKLTKTEAKAYERYLHLAGESEARDAVALRNNPDILKPGEVPKHLNPELVHNNLEVTEPYPKNVGIRGEDLDAELPDDFIPDGVFGSRGAAAAPAPKIYTKDIAESELGLSALHDDVLSAVHGQGPNLNLLKSYYPKDLAATAVDLGLTPKEIASLKKSLTPGGQAAFDKHYAKIKKSYDDYMAKYGQIQEDEFPEFRMPEDTSPPLKETPPNAKFDIEAAKKAIKAIQEALGAEPYAPPVEAPKSGLGKVWKEVKGDIAAAGDALKQSLGFKSPSSKVEIKEPPSSPTAVPVKTASPLDLPGYLNKKNKYAPAEGYPKLNYHWNPNPEFDAKVRSLIQSNFKGVDWQKFDPLKYDKWQEDRPPVKFEVPEKHIQNLGGNTKTPLWKGGNMMDYPPEIVDPTGKVAPNTGGPAKTKFEKGFFLADNTYVSSMYANMGKSLPYIALPKKPVLEFDWSQLANKFGMHHAPTNAAYNPMLMKYAIDAGREAGADMILAHNIIDLGGLQTQYIVLNPNILRAPHAKFDPSKLHLRWPLAGLAGAGVYTYLASGDEARAEGRKRGGGVKKRHPQIDENPQDHEFIDFSRGGLIDSHIPGRTDKIPMRVRPGSYVLPADIPSALGEGNSKAGAEILKKMFTHSAYGLPPPHIHGHEFRPPHMMRPPARHKADGGKSSHVPIVAAGGEFVIHPDVVHHIGQGSMTKGHKLLDKFVLHTRREHIKTLRKLKPPK